MWENTFCLPLELASQSSGRQVRQVWLRWRFPAASVLQISEYEYSHWASMVELAPISFDSELASQSSGRQVRQVWLGRHPLFPHLWFSCFGVEVVKLSHTNLNRGGNMGTLPSGRKDRRNRGVHNAATGGLACPGGWTGRKPHQCQA